MSATTHANDAAHAARELAQQARDSMVAVVATTPTPVAPLIVGARKARDIMKTYSSGGAAI